MFVDVFSCRLIHACYCFGQAISCHAFIDPFHAYTQLHGLKARTVTCGCIYISMEARLAYMHYMHIDSSSTACMHQDYHACMLTFFVRQEPQPKDDKAEVPK